MAETNLSRSGLPKGKKSRGTKNLTLKECYAVLREGRSIILVFNDGTERRKYSQRIVQEAVEAVGEPLNPVGTGQEPKMVYWKNDVTLHFLPYNPIEEDEYGPVPPLTDVVNVIIPADWVRE